MSSFASRLKGLAINLSLLVVATLLVLSLSEAALRLLGRFPPNPRIFPGQRVVSIPRAHFDPLIGWKKPGGGAQLHETLDYSVAFSANSDGFRGEREFTIEPGMRRIAFLGDSFTFGTGVDHQETFPHLIEGLLDENWLSSLQPSPGRFSTTARP